MQRPLRGHVGLSLGHLSQTEHDIATPSCGRGAPCRCPSVLRARSIATRWRRSSRFARAGMIQRNVDRFWQSSPLVIDGVIAAMIDGVKSLDPHEVSEMGGVLVTTQV